VNLPELLAEDLAGWMDAAADGVPRRVLLWLDAEQTFLRLVARLGPALTTHGARLLTLEPPGGQLALKLALLRLEDEPAAGRAVVYLPGRGIADLEPRPGDAPPALWGLYEYRFKGCVWGTERPWRAGELQRPPDLLSWLVEHGLHVADEVTARELAAGGADALIARYAERQLAIAPVHWPRPLRKSDVLAALAGDPRDTLRGLLAAPAAEVARWGIDGPLVRERVAQEYGVVAPDETGSDAAADPEMLADDAALQLALTEAWDAFGRPADFPFLSRLPGSEQQRRQQARFLRDEVICHTELGPRFLARMRRLEPSYPLDGWAEGRTGQPVGLPLLALARWRRLLDALSMAMAQGWKAGRDELLQQRAAIEAAAGAASADGETDWPALAELLALADGVAAAADPIAAARDTAALVRGYTEEWWQIDLLHLRVRAACARLAGLEEAARLADLLAFDHAVRAADRFAALVEQSGCWPPAGLPGVETLRPALWEGRGRVAVLIVDALRWDLAATLRERLGGETALQPAAATLPAITPFGMAALMPLDAGGSQGFAAPALPIALEVDCANKPFSLRPAGGPNLGTRDGRKAFLTETLTARRGEPPAFVDLDDLLKRARVPSASTVVVFDNGIDEHGHKGTEELPGLVEGFITALKRGVEKLHDAGVGTVHLVTDHGFLLLPPDAIDGLGTPRLEPAEVVRKEQRWAALKPGVASSEVIRLPLPLAPGIAGGFPRGVRTLVKAEAYLHGGISLQECVVPHLVSRRLVPRTRIGLSLEVTTPALATGTVPVVLRPAPPPQAPLGGLEGVTVRLWVETADEGTAPRPASKEIEVEVRPDAGELRPALYLKEGLDLPAGQQLRLRAVDRETGRDLGTLDLTLLVDWD
jgi:hypothetical protein